MKSFIPLIFALSVAVLSNAQTKDCRTILSTGNIKHAYPRLSNDGKTMLFQSNKDGLWQLYTMDIYGNNIRRISRENYNENFPDWSSDNKSIAYVSDRDGNEEIYIANADGSERKRVTSDKGRDIHPYFSPDGKYLLFNSDRANGSFDVFRYTIKTGELKQITNTKDIDETCARYSPDMKSMVMLRNNAKSDDVYIMDVRSNRFRNLTNTPGTTDGWPMYSKDGKWIYYSTMEDGTYDLTRISFDGKRKQKLLAAEWRIENTRVSISADNSFFIYNRDVNDRTIEICYCELNPEKKK